MRAFSDNVQTSVSTLTTAWNRYLLLTNPDQLAKDKLHRSRKDVYDEYKKFMELYEGSPKLLGEIARVKSLFASVEVSAAVQKLTRLQEELAKPPTESGAPGKLEAQAETLVLEAVEAMRNEALRNEDPLQNAGQ